jgi:hypothetical protein
LAILKLGRLETILGFGAVPFVTGSVVYMQFGLKVYLLDDV